MSEEVYYRGILKEVPKLKGETLENLCKRILEDRKIKLDIYYTTYEEQLMDDCYDEYISHEDILYSIEKENISLYDDIFKMNKDKDGVLKFELKYYDGGCGFSEALEEAFNNITIDKQYPLKLTHEATKLNKFTCPSCLNVHEEQTSYCCFCGQKLDWEE